MSQIFYAGATPSSLASAFLAVPDLTLSTSVCNVVHVMVKPHQAHTGDLRDWNCPTGLFSNLRNCDGVLLVKLADADAVLVSNLWGETTKVLLEDVKASHRATQYNDASDKLLHFIVKSMKMHDYAALDDLMERLSSDVINGAVEYKDDRGQARLLNTLALTRRIKNKLQHRSSLRVAYRDLVAVKEGARAADRAVSGL